MKTTTITIKAMPVELTKDGKRMYHFTNYSLGRKISNREIIAMCSKILKVKVNTLEGWAKEGYRVPKGTQMIKNYTVYDVTQGLGLWRYVEPKVAGEKGKYYPTNHPLYTINQVVPKDSMAKPMDTPKSAETPKEEPKEPKAPKADKPNKSNSRKTKAELLEEIEALHAELNEVKAAQVAPSISADEIALIVAQVAQVMAARK